MPVKVHKLELRRREGTTGIMTGASTQVLLDGQPLRGVKSLSFQANARGTALLTLEMYADVQVAADVELVLKKAEGGDYELGRMDPRPESLAAKALEIAREQGAHDEDEKN